MLKVFKENVFKITLLWSIIIIFSTDVFAQTVQNPQFFGLYIGQDYWESYEQVKKIIDEIGIIGINSNIHSNESGINVTNNITCEYDSNSKLKLIELSPSIIIGMQKKKFSDMNEFISSIISQIHGENIKIDKYKDQYQNDVYVFRNYGIKINFNIRPNGFINVIIIEKDQPEVGPIVNKIRLGIDKYQAMDILHDNYNRTLINEPARDNSTYKRITTEIHDFGWMGDNLEKIFNVEGVDKSFIQKFFNAYSINAEKIEFSEYRDKCNDHLTLDNRYFLEYDDILNESSEIYDGGKFCVIFIYKNDRHPNFLRRGAVIISSKTSYETIGTPPARPDRAQFN